jgi:hypothetical protein
MGGNAQHTEEARKRRSEWLEGQIRREHDLIAARGGFISTKSRDAISIFKGQLLHLDDKTPVSDHDLELLAQINRGNANAA